MPFSVRPMGLLWQSCKQRYKVWAHSHPGYTSSLRYNSIHFGCTWGDLCFLFLQQPGYSYKRHDNSRIVIWQMSPLQENQHIVCLSTFTTLWSSAVCQSINESIIQCLFWAITGTHNCCQTLSVCQKSFLKILPEIIDKICNIVPGQHKFHS